MKKILLSLVALASVTLAGAQELAGYTATSSMSSTDIPQIGANVVNKGIASSTLPGMSILSDATGKLNAKITGKGWAIGFDFPYNGKQMKYFGISANGSIKLSETEDITMQSANRMYSVTTANGGDNTIWFYDQQTKSYATGNEAGKDTTTISYTSSADELVVYFSNLGINTSSWSTELVGTYSVQIHLMKDGTIKYIFFGLNDLESTSAGNVYMGIRGDYNEYLCWAKGPTDMTKTWQYVGTGFKLPKLENGYTVTLNTPKAVEAPTAQPTDLQMETTYYDGYISAGMTFTASGADKYLALCSEGAPTELPEDGNIYTKGDSLGNAYVMLADVRPNGKFYTPHLNHDKNYTVTIYSYNSFGTGGAKYNAVEPLQANIQTGPEKPVAFEVVSTSNNSIALAVTANEADQPVMVVYNDTTENPGNYGNIPFVGDPKDFMRAGSTLYRFTEDGDTIEAGRVAYFGPAREFTVKGLKPSTSYYFAAYSYNPETQMFSDQGADKRNSQAYASTNIVAPFVLDSAACAKAPESCSLGGWISTPGGQYQGFQVTDPDGDKVTPLVENARHYEAQSGQSSDETYTLVTPTIENADSVSLDWHIHVKGAGYFGKATVYEEWAEKDTLAFCAIVDGETIVLKQYTSADSPTQNDTTTACWHSEKFSLAEYAGKDVKFAIKWLATCSNIAYFSFENLKITKQPTFIDKALEIIAKAREFMKTAIEQIKEAIIEKIKELLGYIDEYNTNPTEENANKVKVATQELEDLLNNGTATGINTVNNSNNSSNATKYNLAGQRVNAAQNGIVIMNGKKVVVK